MRCEREEAERERSEERGERMRLEGGARASPFISRGWQKKGRTKQSYYSRVELSSLLISHR